MRNTNNIVIITTISLTILKSYTNYHRYRSIHKQMAYKRAIVKYKSPYVQHEGVEIQLFTGYNHTELYSPLWFRFILQCPDVCFLVYHIKFQQHAPS